MKQYLSIFAIGLLLPLIGFGQEEKECHAKNYSELLGCIERNSFDNKISNQQSKAAYQLKRISEQWINPELDLESVSKGSDKEETSASLLFTIRLGGKKESLVNEANAEIEKATAMQSITRMQVRLASILQLYRLSHLKSEIVIEEESIGIFSKIVSQFQNRKALSPEQDASLSVFKMALADHQFKVIKLKAEEDKIYQTFKSDTGLPKAIISTNLPSKIKDWKQVLTLNQITSSQLLKATEADLKLARAQKSKIESEAWPEITLGPTVKSVKEQNDSSTLVGVKLSMPLPLFNIGGAKIDYYAEKQNEAEIQFESAKRKIISLREEHVARYTQHTQALKNILNLNTVNEKHQKLEKQFFKGVVSSSLMIEAHRQLFELEERRNSTELEAIESLGQVLIIDNKFEQAAL